MERGSEHSTGQGRRVGVRVSRPAMFAKSADIIRCHIFSWGRLSCCFVLLHLVVVVAFFSFFFSRFRGWSVVSWSFCLLEDFSLCLGGFLVVPLGGLLVLPPGGLSKGRRGPFVMPPTIEGLSR